MSTQLPPPPGSPKAASASIWKQWWFWVAMVVVVAVAASVASNDTSGGGDDTSGGGDDAADCHEAAAAWLETLQSAFYREYRNAAITPSGYVEADTSEGRAYYVAVKVEGVAGVAVFGTSDPPLQADPGLIAAANSAASQLSDLGADISEDSSAGTLLLDDNGTLHR